MTPIPRSDGNDAYDRSSYCFAVFLRTDEERRS